MKKTKILLVGALLFGVPSVALNVNHHFNDATVVRAEEKSLTILPTDFNSESYAKNDGEHIIDGLAFNSKNVMLQSNVMQFKKNAGYIQSTSAVDGYISKIELNIQSGSFFVSTGTSKLTTATSSITSTSNIYIPTNASDTFFYIKVSSNTGKLNSIKITYSNNDTPSAKYYIKYENTTTLPNGCFKSSVIKGSDLPTPDDTLEKTFIGWYLDAELTTKIEDTTEITLDENNITSIYAAWKDIEYEVTNISEVISKANGTFVVEGEIVGKRNDSTAFIQDSTGGIMLYDTSSVLTSLKLGDNVKLKGKYTLFNQCHELTSISIISTSSDGKIDTLPITDKKDVTKDNSGKYVKINNLKIKSAWSGSTKNGYTASLYNYDFVLFYSNKDFSKNTDLVTKDSYVNVEGCITIYNSTLEVLVTNVEKADTFTITFNSLGGTTISSQTIGEGEKFTKPSNPTKEETKYESYEFAGWYLDEECSEGKEFNFDSDVTSDIAVYAKWNVIKKSISTTFTSVETKANLGFDYTETLTTEEDASTNTFVPNKVEAPFTTNGYTFSNGFGLLSSTTSYIEFEVEHELIDIAEINFSGVTNNNGKIKFVSYDKNRQVIETSTEYTLTTEYSHIICKLTKYENVKYIRLEVSELSENDKVSISAYQVDTYFAKETTTYTNFRNVMMQFRYEFDTSKFEDVSSIGIALTKNVDFNFEQQGLEALPENIKLYETKKDNGIDYNTSLTIGVKNIPASAYDTNLVAVAYVKTTEGKYYFAKKSTFNVNGMVLTYLDMLDKTTEMYKILDAFAYTL